MAHTNQNLFTYVLNIKIRYYFFQFENKPCRTSCFVEAIRMHTSPDALTIYLHHSLLPFENTYVLRHALSTASAMLFLV